MEKLIEILKDNFLLAIIGILGILFPGILTIFLFDQELFIKLDVIKLLILSASISANSFVAIMFVIIIIAPFAYTKQTQTKVALIVNLLIFLVMLLVKLFWRSLSVEHFVVGIIILLGVFSFIVWISVKKGNKES